MGRRRPYGPLARHARLGHSSVVRARPGSLLATALARSTHFWGRSGMRLSDGPACGGRAVKAKPTADAGPTAPRGAAPIMILWMQTTDALLLAVSRCSSPRVWTLAQDSRSAYGLLYLAAVWASWHEQEHRQGTIDSDPSLVSYRHGVVYCRSPGISTSGCPAHRLKSHAVVVNAGGQNLVRAASAYPGSRLRRRLAARSPGCADHEPIRRFGPCLVRAHMGPHE